MSPAPDQSGTRQRLLDAAIQVFARCGFDDASTREICALAEANPAAINYHFGSKEALWQEVLRIPLQRVEASIAGFTAPGLSLEQALTLMYEGMLAPLRPDLTDGLVMRLAHQAFANHRHDHHDLGGGIPHRHNQALVGLLRQHLTRGVTSTTLDILSGSLVGMALHALHGRMHDDGHLPLMLPANADAAAVAALSQRLARYGVALVASENARAALEAALATDADADRPIGRESHTGSATPVPTPVPRLNQAPGSAGNIDGSKQPRLPRRRP